MPYSKVLGIAVASTAALVVGGVWTWRAVRRWRRKSPDEIERLRRLEVNACGRISVGQVLELAEPMADGPAGPIVLYEYAVAGVTYEAAQDVAALPKIAAAAPLLPGQTISVKYDPRQPSNSILGCEAWCGIPELEPHRSEVATRPEDSLPQ